VSERWAFLHAKLRQFLDWTANRSNPEELQSEQQRLHFKKTVNKYFPFLVFFTVMKQLPQLDPRVLSVPC
jgi:hypothetical protein